MTVRMVAAAVVAAVVLAGCTSTVRPTLAARVMVFDLRSEDFVTATPGVIGVHFPVPEITEEALARGMTVAAWWLPSFWTGWRVLPYSFHEENDTHAVTVSYSVNPDAGSVVFSIESGDPVAVHIWRDLSVGKVRIVLTGHPDDLNPM